MKVIAKDYLPGARYAYPTGVVELSEMMPFADLVKGMKKSDWSCVVVRRSRALFQRYSGGQVWRRYIAVRG